jgi:hypothetical protein
MAERKRKPVAGADYRTHAPSVSILTRDERKLTARVLRELRKRHEAGDNASLLHAVDFAARAGMRLPGWVVQAFCRCYEDWAMFRAPTLDAAFGVPRKKGMHVKTREIRERLKARVVLEVMRERRKSDPPTPLGDALFENVGKRLGVSRSVASDLYYGTPDNPNPWRKILESLQPKSLG